MTTVAGPSVSASFTPACRSGSVCDCGERFAKGSHFQFVE